MSPAKMEKVEIAMRTAIKFVEAFNGHDPERIAELLSDMCLLDDHNPFPAGTLIKGKGAIRNHYIDLFRNHPGIELEIEDLSGFGRSCVMRWIIEYEDGSHLRGISIFETDVGSVTEIRSYVKG